MSASASVRWTIRDLSHVGYWDLKAWRYGAEEAGDKCDDYSDHNRQWLAELNAEIARRSWQAPPDGYDVHNSPMWLDACNAYFAHKYRRELWVETADERAKRMAWDAWLQQDIAKLRKRLARERGAQHADFHHPAQPRA